MLNNAIKYIENGLSILPAQLITKQPDFDRMGTDRKWKKFQTVQPSIDQINKWFKPTTNPEAIALICGSISGNLELLDIDNKFGDADVIFNDFKELCFNTAPELFNCLTIEKTQSGGYHLMYKCSKIEGNIKLARRYKEKPKFETIIETRGEGGYALVDPTPGYQLIQGDICSIPIISEEDRELLISISKSFEEVIDSNYQPDENYLTQVKDDRPGDAFNAKGDALEILQNHGWTVLGNGERKTLVRPGKNIRQGVSATFNYSGLSGKKLYVFSTNAHPFEDRKSYDPFSVYAMLEHNGNFKEAAKDLLKKGFGTPAKSNGVKNNTPKSSKNNDTNIEKFPNQFWHEELRNAEYKLAINKSLLIEWFEAHGFCKYWMNKNVSVFVRIQENVVSETTPEVMFDFLKSEVKKLPFQITENCNKYQLWELISQRITGFKSNDYLQTINIKNINFIRDTKDVSFFFFKNCFVEVTPDSVTQKDYSLMNGMIWEDQRINHNFNLLDKDIYSDTSSCVFGLFLEKVCSPENKEFPGDRSKRIVDMDRLNSLVTSIGYMLHTYKNPSVTKAIILCEEKIAKDDDSNGRTGKGLTAVALSKLRKRTFFSGKQVDFRDRFLYQKVSPDTQFLYFDDVKKHFDFESLFTILTEGLTIEKKGQKSVDIGYSDSPKIMISTNSVLSNDTDSYKARKFEIEFTDYFTADYQPINEFNSLFFEDGWKPDDPEWDKFYSFMIYSTQHYIVNGLIDYEKANLEERKLLSKMPEEFIDFAQSHLNKLKDGAKVYKHELYAKFIEDNKIYGPSGKFGITQKKTTSWFTFILKFNKLEFVIGRDETSERKEYFILPQLF